MQWVENAATSVATYYGRFPVPRDRVLIMPAEDRHGVMQGTTWGDVGGFPAFTRIRLGQHTTVDELTDDWMMTHELVHGGLPFAGRRPPLDRRRNRRLRRARRARPGRLSCSPRRSGRTWCATCRRAIPSPATRASTSTHTWGRTYWGGAQFCLLADVTIREQTHNRKGLQDALARHRRRWRHHRSELADPESLRSRRRGHRNPRPRRSVQAHGQRARHRRP